MDMLDSGKYQQKYSMRINWQYEICNRVFCNCAAIHGVGKSQTQLSGFHFHFHFNALYVAGTQYVSGV